MDIGLPKTNGMDTAALLRKIDQSVTLIFVTNMAQFAIHGYEVDAFDFVVKPVSYEAFVLKLQRALNRLQSRRNTDIVISQGDNLFRMSTSQILYVEISSHDLIYHTTDGIVKSYGSLKQVEQEVNSKLFARCNSCYLVNLGYVQTVVGDTVTIVGGETLKMSRLKRKPFLLALNDYLGGKA